MGTLNEIAVIENLIDALRAVAALDGNAAALDFDLELRTEHATALHFGGEPMVFEPTGGRAWCAVEVEVAPRAVVRLYADVPEAVAT